MERSSVTTPTTTTTAEPKASLWEDFLDIFYAPSQVFERRKDGRFGMALLILAILAAVLFYASSMVLQNVWAGEMARGMAQAAANPQVTPEQLAGMRRVGVIIGQISALISIPIVVIITGLVLWLVGKLFDSQMSVKQGFMVATYANVPRLLQLLVGVLQGLLLDVSDKTRLYEISVSAARFADVDTTSEFVLALLSRLDPFLIWITILLGIGLAITGKISKGKAMAAAFAVWVLGTLPAFLGALRQ
jgi:hypothetical protein